MAVGRDRCACVGGMNMHVCVWVRCGLTWYLHPVFRSKHWQNIHVSLFLAGDYPSVFVTKLLRCDIVRVEWVHDCPAEQCACVELSWRHLRLWSDHRDLLLRHFYWWGRWSLISLWPSARRVWFNPCSWLGNIVAAAILAKIVLKAVFGCLCVLF